MLFCYTHSSVPSPIIHHQRGFLQQLVGEMQRSTAKQRWALGAPQKWGGRIIGAREVKENQELTASTKQAHKVLKD